MTSDDVTEAVAGSQVPAAPRRTTVTVDHADVYDIVPDAVQAADAAAAAAGVNVCEVTSLVDLEAVVRLYATIWGRDPNPPVHLELLRALTKAGNYIAGAFDGDELVGACVGFFMAPGQRGLHSHIAGVARQALGRNVGFALKVHQRAWSLQRELTKIYWTFDPLVSRNAHFNLVKLGATAEDYLRNFYGPMADTINGLDETDRLLVRWRLTDPKVAACCVGVSSPTVATDRLAAGAVIALGVSDDGTPVPGRLDGRTSLVAVPADIEAIRRTNPELAMTWRVAVRETLTALAAADAQITGFDRTGWYIIDREHVEGGLP
jgi:predicted GNAT superfamily acetyltransferase